MLDTDVFSFFLKGDTRAALYEKHTKRKTIALSFVTVGELLLWPKIKGWGEAKLTELERRINLTAVIPYDMVICETYAELKAKLTKVGMPVPDNDLWIAATAVRHSIPLISHNRKHYDEIPDLVFISETPKVLKRQMELGETGG